MNCTFALFVIFVADMHYCLLGEDDDREDFMWWAHFDKDLCNIISLLDREISLIVTRKVLRAFVEED